jgi:nitric oxide reductase activation protein
VREPGIHYAKLDSSSRLQKLLMHLSDGAEHSTLDIIKNTSLCAINSAISELRRNGIAVTCRRIGREVWTYQLTDLAGDGWLVYDGRESA